MASNTVHISLGKTANHVTSHLLNLQGLAATSSSPSSSGGDTNDNDVSSSLCDASVTHDISAVDSDYSSSRSGSSSSRYMYVPRTLILDGKDSFGTAWGGVSCNSNNYNNQQQHQTASSTTSTTNGSDAWNGTVSIFDASDHANIFGDQQRPQNQQNDTRIPQNNVRIEDDPLHKFQSAASIMGLSPIHSRFNATLPSHSSYNVSSSAPSSRHVQWDEEEEEEEEDDYYYGQNDERIQEEKRRQLEKMEHQQREERKNWNTCMEDAWKETFYGASSVQHDKHCPSSSIGSNEVDNNSTSDIQPENTSDKATYNSSERDIRWYDYWMPPKPSQAKYQVPLPFDTATTNNSSADPNSSLWSTSFNMGYNPTSSGGGMTTGGNSSNGITHSWREHVLSESLRKVLEGCDVVKGFNIFVDGGGRNNNGFSNNTDPSSNGGTNKHTKQLSNIMAGGGFHAGLATSLLEELSEECRSAGRWVVMVDPISSSNNTYNENENNTEGNQVHQFRQRLNAGLALHGLSTNADAFLPVSIDCAYTALRGTNSTPTSSNRILFEGSAAVALALEASTLFYRLHHRQPSSSFSSGRRSRIGIQSGFYQGSSGNGYEESDNEPYASTPALTYHEFLACARPSSDRRRSILELDALLRPISFPSASGGGGTSGAGGVDVASLMLASGGQVSPSILASLTSSGLVSGGTTAMGELQKRIMRGTSVERMRMEQERQQFRSSRNRASTKQSEPGDWMEDMSTLGGGGLLSSLSGNSTPFGRRANHHHFALSTSLRPAASEKSGGDCTSAFLRPMMESMGVRYRPEVSLGSVVKDSVSDLTGVGSYWRSIFADRRSSAVSEGGDNVSAQTTRQPPQKLSSRDIATHTSVLSVLGNSTRSYPRINSISTGFIDSLHSRRNRGYLSRDVMSGIMPEQDDCEEALEYCQELVDVYEPPLGSGLVDGEDENDDIDAYHDEDE